MERHYAPGTLLPGTIYRVIREVGRGGMGRVYQVEDTTVGKTYALKVLLQADAEKNPNIIERMRQESRLLARIAHPNIVDVITSGITADGNIYYVMAFLNGSSLRKILVKRKRIDPVEVVSFGIDIAEALERAHHEGVVHRDVKPDNIFINVRRDMTTHGVIVDFGVAGLLVDARGHADELGKLFGTPRYAAPEQQRGSRVTPKMDVWGLGMCFFELIVGHIAFKGRTLTEIIKAVQGKEPAARISDFIADILPELDELIARMLDKDPSRRPDMSRVVLELKDIQKRQEVFEAPLHDDNRTQETLVSAAMSTSPGDEPFIPPPHERSPSTRSTPHVDTLAIARGAGPHDDAARSEEIAVSLDDASGAREAESVIPPAAEPSKRYVDVEELMTGTRSVSRAPLPSSDLRPRHTMVALRPSQPSLLKRTAPISEAVTLAETPRAPRPRWPQHRSAALLAVVAVPLVAGATAILVRAEAGSPARTGLVPASGGMGPSTSAEMTVAVPITEPTGGAVPFASASVAPTLAPANTKGSSEPAAVASESNPSRAMPTVVAATTAAGEPAPSAKAQPPRPARPAVSARPRPAPSIQSLDDLDKLLAR